ncbi:MAG: hypothetical protein K5650_07190 [Bacteroidales bacterium]|nr:hypothetical protein [Bacteroidales bacterium]
MKSKTIIQIGLGIVIVALAVVLYNSIMKPVRFENEYNKRREACAEKLKAIRTLEEAYKVTYTCYTGSFDTLFTRLLTEDSMKVISKSINYDKIPADVDINEISELEAIKLGYVTRGEILINPIAKLREDGKLPITDINGHVRQMTDEEILNLRYVPYPKGEKYDFKLEAGTVQQSGYQVPVFMCSVDMNDLLADMDKQQVINKIAELDHAKKFIGWKVGDMTQPIVDGNFE